jgi:hypothetical protein
MSKIREGNVKQDSFAFYIRSKIGGAGSRIVEDKAGRSAVDQQVGF